MVLELLCMDQRLDEDLNQRAHEHIPLINDTIHGEGYTGMTVYDINIRPIF